MAVGLDAKFGKSEENLFLKSVQHHHWGGGGGMMPK